MNLSIIPRPKTTPANNGDTTAECGNCGSKDSWVLHHVRRRGIYRRLCTSCVLRLHPDSFCPSCFAFYDSSPPPPSKRLSCHNCSSFTHTHCATTHPIPPYAFLCPPCADPNFTFINLDRTKNRAIDKKMATVLLCAAKIAASSMAKAVTVARAEAERRVREAAVCRKRAREALEHVALVAKRKEMDEVSGSGDLGKRETDGVDGVVIGSPTNVERIVAAERLKSNGNANNNLGYIEKDLENGNNAVKNPSLDASHGSINVKEEALNSLVHNNS